MNLLFSNTLALLRLLKKRDVTFLLVFALLTSLFALFDILALGLIAIATNIAIGGSSSLLPGLSANNPESLILLFGAVALLLTAKSTALLFANNKVLKRISKIEVELGNSIFINEIEIPWYKRSDKSIAEIVRLADTSVFRSVSTFLYPMLSIPALIATLIAVITVLLIAQPITALVTVCYFAIISLLLQKYISPRSRKSGLEDHKNRVKLNQTIHELMSASKEIQLRNKIFEASEWVSEFRTQASKSTANYIFLSNMPRQVLEIALVGGVVIIGVVNFAIGGIPATVSSISLFAIAGFRIVPAISSLQATLSSAIASQSFVNEVVKALDEPTKARMTQQAEEQSVGWNFETIQFKNVCFSYSDTPSRLEIDRVNLEIKHGEKIGIVGPSGAGKSTFIDLVLHLLEPTSGQIYVDGVPISGIKNVWQKSVGYVPQQVVLMSGTIAQNVALTWADDYNLEAVVSALKKSQLFSHVSKLPQGLLTPIGENGLSLSGGQRQRLGIARALYFEPKILVLDEATSALDSVTEKEISDVIDNMEKSVTVIAVAHRLSTIAHFDRIAYFEEGRLVQIGTFEQLRKSIPDFERQVKLSGKD